VPCDDISESINIEHTRRDRFALAIPLLGSVTAELVPLVEALDGADIACDLVDPDGEVVSCEIEVDRDGDDLTILAWTDDTEWPVDTVVRFDVETVSEAMGRYTLLPGSTLTVRGDVTQQEVGS